MTKLPEVPEAQAPDAPDEEALSTSPEVVAGSFKEYMVGWARRVRGGDSGVLPVIAGLIAIVIVFQSQTSIFLSAGNLTNLVIQSAVFMLLGMGEVSVLLLGEIDLSIGYVAGIGAAITAILVSHPMNEPWWIGVLAGLAGTTLIGLLQGTLITRLRLPSFVVTLAGLLGWEGVLILLVDNSGAAIGGTIRTSNVRILNDIVNGNLSPIAGWIVMIVVVGLFATFTAVRDVRRRSSGLAAPPLGLTAAKILFAAAAGIVLVLVCNTNRGFTFPLRGVPWVVLVVLAIFSAWTFLLGRTRYGRYIYAIGGNPEAARRAGVNLARIRTIAFGLTGLTAGVAGIVYESWLGSISIDINGGTYVLYAVAAAVIGGTSLFGGRGKALHAVLGGLVIAAIYNGLGLLGMSASAQYMVTALVLLAAVTVDAVARRGSGTPQR